MRTTFAISDTSPDTFEVIWNWWGREEYRFNGELLAHYWSAAFSGERRFEVPGHVVRIAFAVRGQDYIARAYVDDQVRVAELFPELQMKTQRKVPLKSRLITIAIWMVIGMVGSYVYLKITRG